MDQNRSFPVGSVIDVTSQETSFFEHDSSTLHSTHQIGCLPSLDLETSNVRFESGNQTVTVLGHETEGKINCKELQYGTAMVETKKEESLVEDSDILLKDKEFVSCPLEISNEKGKNNIDCKLLLLSRQSNSDFDPTFPEFVEKNFDGLNIGKRESDCDDNFGLEINDNQKHIENVQDWIVQNYKSLEQNEILCIQQNPRMHIKPLVQELPRPPDCRSCKHG